METVSAPDYFDAGLDLLADGGREAVTVAALCRRLHVTKGSFYHHFTGVPDFLERLLLQWESQELEIMTEAQLRAALERPTEFAKVAAAWRVRHEAETAIRAMARTDAYAAEVQGRVDRQREDSLCQLFVTMGIGSSRSRILARLGLAILIGTQQREHPVDRHRLEETLGEYQLWVEQAAATSARASSLEG